MTWLTASLCYAMLCYTKNNDNKNKKPEKKRDMDARLAMSKLIL